MHNGLNKIISNITIGKVFENISCIYFFIFLQMYLNILIHVLFMYRCIFDLCICVSRQRWMK